MDSFKEQYINFYIDRFLYEDNELKKIAMFSDALKAFNYLMQNNLNVWDIPEIGQLVNDDSVATGFRKIEVTAGEKATFEPEQPKQIINKLYILFDNYQKVWCDADVFEKEAKFHINYMRIHPLENGNKRTGRLILSTNLAKQGYAMALFSKDDTDCYYDLINNQNYDEFAQFIRDLSSQESHIMEVLYESMYGVQENSKEIIKKIR